MWHHHGFTRVSCVALHAQFVRSFSVSIAALMTIGWVSSSILALAAFISYTMVGTLPAVGWLNRGLTRAPTLWCALDVSPQMGLPLTASVVFPVLYLFDSIVWPMLNLPEVLGRCVVLGEAYTSRARHPCRFCVE